MFALFLSCFLAVVFGLSSPDIQTRVYKVALIGDLGVEKSSLLRHFSALTSPPIQYGLTIHIFRMGIEEGFKQTFQIWEISDIEKFPPEDIVEGWFKGTAGAIIAFDTTSIQSFENASKWIEALKRSGGSNLSVIFLIATKTHQADKRKVEEEKIKKLLSFHEIEDNFETTSDYKNAAEIFKKLLEKIREKRKE